MVIVAIAGGTGSGKTTLSKKIIDSYKNIKVNYLSLDSYYKDYSNLSFSERAKINFDHPDSIDLDLFLTDSEYLKGSNIKTLLTHIKGIKDLKKGNLRQEIY